MTYTVSVSFLNAKILTTSHVPKVRKVMLSFPEGCKCNGKKTKQTNYMKTLAFFLSDLINIGQCNSIKYCKLGDTDPCGVVTLSLGVKGLSSSVLTVTMTFAT